MSDDVILFGIYLRYVGCYLYSIFQIFWMLLFFISHILDMSDAFAFISLILDCFKTVVMYINTF